jgi:DNA-binding FadR family transcriptional regulator
MLEDTLAGGDHEILVGRVAAAGGGTGEPLVYWAGEYRSLTTEMPRSDQLANASDGLAVAYHVLDVGPAEMLDAQNSIEPAIAALASVRTSPEQWDRLDDLVDQSELVVDQPDDFNRLALAFHGAIADAAGNRLLQATLPVSARCNRSTTVTAVVLNRHEPLSQHIDICSRCCVAAIRRRPGKRCASI